MGRAPCCDKANVKRGPWSPEEDAILKNYVQQHGTGGNWIALPHKAGLRRCGKSCRLRWLNYLRPDIKHGGFSEEEDNVICSLYSSIGSRWSIIAAQLPGRTDNDIKNYWNTRLKKKLLGKCKDQRTTRRLSPATTKQLESALSASASPANSSVSLTAHDDRISSTAASTLPYATLDHGGIVPLVNLEQSSSPVSKISAPGFANAQERSNYLKEMYSFGYSTLRNMLLRPEIAAIVGDDYSSTNNIDYLMTSPISTSNNVSIGQISPFALDIPAGQQHEDPQDLYGRYAIEVKTEPSQLVPGVASLTDQNESSASPMALWESCCSSAGRNNYIDSAWLNGLSSLEDPHAARTSCLGCGSLTPTELNQMYCDTSLMQPKDEPTNCYSLYNGVVRNAGTAYCNVSEPKSTATFCPNYSDNYIFPASSDEVVSSQGIFQEAEIIY